jgi:hypothetical protein
MIPVVIKPYLCWRAPDADVELFTDLFRYGYHEGMHKSAFGKSESVKDSIVRWRSIKGSIDTLGSVAKLIISFNSIFAIAIPLAFNSLEIR